MKKKLVLKKKIRIALNKFLITIIIFLLGMIVGKENPNMKKQIQKNIYETNFPFQKVKTWYEKKFGKLLSMDKIVKETEPVFKEKLSYQQEEAFQNGVKLKVDKNYLVPVLESGVVVYIGEKEKIGTTIIIEQVDGVDTFYSNITLQNKKLYDYVEKGELLGEVKDQTLYLSFQKKGEYLDYKNYL